MFEVEHRKYVKDNQTMTAMIVCGKVQEMHYVKGDIVLPETMATWKCSMTLKEFHDKIVKEMGFMEQ